MKKNLARGLVIALVLLAGAAFSVSAMPLPQGREVPLDQNIIQYFVKNGVDATVLSTPAAQLSSDDATKINAIVSSPDFAAMVWSDLRVDAAAFGNTLWMPIGNTIFEFSQAPGGAQQSMSTVSAS